MNKPTVDVVIVGGGPAGLAAALALGRARKQVLVCDGGPRRNALAAELHNFVTRDGATPEAFRAEARKQLEAYPNVEVTDARLTAVTGARGAFRVSLPNETVEARRVLLTTGLVDTMLPIEGFSAVWGHGVYQCPYCHGWEVRGQRWGYLVQPAHLEHLHLFALQLRGWTRALTVFTTHAVELPDATRAALDHAGIAFEPSPVVKLMAQEGHLASVALANGETVPCDVLFAHPPQQQVELVRALGLATDAEGFVRIDAMTRETSTPGIYAGGDLTTRMQGAIFAAAAGTHAATMLNFELTSELVALGLI